MARIARVVAPYYPHHIIQRGNRRQQVFFIEKDYKEYLNLLHTHSDQFDLEILAYCLMPNHVHIVALPNRKESLARAIGETHRKYTRMVNLRENWRGYLWQGRFSSYVLNEAYLLTATRYVLFNPVKAKMVKKPWDYKWSSARGHLGMENNSVINKKFLGEMVGDWKTFLNIKIDDKDVEVLKKHERTGRPLGDNSFIEKLEKVVKISLRKKKTGPKKGKIKHN